MIQQTKYKTSIDGSASAKFVVEGMASVGIQISGTFVGTLVFEATIDGTNWFSVSLLNPVTGLLASTTTTTGSWILSCGGLWSVRARLSAYTSGKATVNFQTATSKGMELQGSNGNVASGATDSGNPVKVGGKYNSTAPTFTDGQRGDLQIDANGNLKTSMATALSKLVDSITTRPEATTYLNMTASALVRTGAGILVGMYVNSTSSGTIKFWDQTSAAVPVMNNTITPAIGYHNLGSTAFATGLYATIGGTLDVTLYYIPTP